MTPKQILCPVDFSPCSNVALERACEMAEETGAKLFIVHVDSGGQTLPPGHSGYVEELDQHKRLLEEAVPSSQDIDFEQHYLRGNVADEIQRFAKLREVDVIVMGSHGRTGLAKLLMGSVAESVTQAAPCEVITVPNPGKGEHLPVSDSTT